MIADVRMPGMNGLELMYEVRSLTMNVQIIVVTASGELEVTIEVLRYVRQR